jgi:hypothetical protein
MLPGNDRQAPLIIAFLIMVSGTIALQNQTPLESIRPAKTSDLSNRPGDLEQVDARLWQDPFSAIATHEKKTSNDTPLKTNSLESKGIFIYKKPDPDLDILKILKNIQFFGIMVPGGPQAENVESRRRRRYAVLSALNVYGFSPHDSSHIGYWKFKINSLNIPLKVPFEILHKENKTIIVLWLDDDYFGPDWIKKHGPLQKLLELDRHILCEKLKFNAYAKQDSHPESDSKPYPKLYYNLCDGKAPIDPITTLSTPQLPLKIIGPAGSTTLRALIDEIKDVPLSEKTIDNKIQIYSPNATVDECLWVDPIERKDCHIGQYIEKKNLGVSFLRTTLTDISIAESIKTELGHRGVDPAKGDGVVFISEWDTFYGRYLPYTFIQAFFPDKKVKGCRVFGAKPEPEINISINCFSYLRGIDGNLSEKPTNAKRDIAEETDPKLVLKLGQMERAEGNNQFDYLVRTVERIHQTIQRKNNVKAIGILGSDFYDKLLVLQAMRHQFPNAVFFTTDIDARFLHRDEYKWTRNLIVGSGFGLELNPILQKHIPPFRDNYQTATFLATFLAMEDAMESFSSFQSPPTDPKKSDDADSKYTAQNFIDNNLSPKIYEIGRTRAFDLTPLSKPKKIYFKELNEIIHSFHPSKPDLTPSIIDILLGTGAFFTFIFLLCFSFSKTIKRTLNLTIFHLIRLRKKYPRRVYGGLFLFILLLSLSFWDIFIRENGEPFAWMEGVSIWPTQIGRLSAGVISFLLIYRGWCFSRKLLAEITRSYPSSKLLRSYMKKSTAGTPQKDDLEKFWIKYKNLSSKNERIKRVKKLTITFIILGILLTRLFVLNNPYRGDLSFCLNFVLLYLFAIPAFLALLFFVVDSFWIHIWFIKELSDKNFTWPEDTLGKLLKSQIPEKMSKFDFFKEWIDIKLIAKQTEVVGNMIYYPYIVLFLLIFFRNPLFDNWNMTIGLGVIFFLCLIYPMVFGYRLRKFAERARLTALDRLEIKRIEYLNSEETIEYLKSKDTRELLSKQLEFVTDYIKNIKEGAFRPFSEQPFFRGLLIPFSGYGGLVIYEFLAMSNI